MIKTIFTLLILASSLMGVWELKDTSNGTFMYNSETGEIWKFTKGGSTTVDKFYKFGYHGSEKGHIVGRYDTPKEAKASWKKYKNKK